MMSGKQEIQSRFRPSNRILDLAQHKTSKTVWATTPCEKLSWGNQEPIWPVSASALGAVPSARIQYLARHKRDFSAREDHRRPPHTPQCENTCPVWHVDPKVKTAVITLRLLQLSNPKLNHPDFQSNRESVASIVSFASKTARISQRLVQLSLPRLKESNICCELGRPEESIWTVSRAARRATVSARVEMLAKPKQLSKDYIPPREPVWSRKKVLPT
ncbi:testicular haploid expressed gene protein-like isoform X2 [Siniperca chuatsi]|uniref:testicular haploid expressed gene protein-like isoform X2 n=1 Tax=Siniperca chuatsi TaxID=119488 RepID=UPI001CE0B67E|nr:testicular haploid expressed gene protein-like isoform X2 [Siniperca chuatsi]